MHRGHAWATRVHEFPPKWLPTLGTCPKATWMTSICEPTAYGASFPMNSRPLLGLAAANLGRFSYANGPWWAMRASISTKMASNPWDMSKGNLDDLYLRTNGLRGVLPHELPPLSGPDSGKSGPLSRGMRRPSRWAMRVMNFHQNGFHPLGHVQRQLG